VSEPDERLERAASLIAERLNAVRFEWNAQGSSVVGPGKTALRVAARHNDDRRHFDIGFVFDSDDPDSRVIWDCTYAWVGPTGAETATVDAVDKWIRVSAPVWLELISQPGEFAAQLRHNDPEGFAGWHAICGLFVGWGDSPGLDELMRWIDEHPLLPALHDSIAPELNTAGPFGLRFFLGGPKPGGTSEVQVDGLVAPRPSEALGLLPWPRPDFGFARAFVLLVHPEPDLARRPEGADYAHSIAVLVRLVSERPEASEDDLATALVASGLTESDAERVLAFAILAFGRVSMSRTRFRQMSFPEHHVIVDPDTGATVRGVTATDPAYVAAVRYARDNKVDSGWGKVALRSSEINALNEALTAEGAEGMDEAKFLEPTFFRIRLSPGKRRHLWQRATDWLRHRQALPARAAISSSLWVPGRRR
jgi:hypothetical protein